MHHPKHVTCAGTLAALLLVPASVQALTTFGSRAAFSAALGSSAIVETWDAFAGGTVIPDGSTVNGITYNSGAGDALVTSSFLPLSLPNGLGDTTLGFFAPGDSITFTFGGPITAFGISFNTFATAPGAYVITTSGGEQALSSYDPFPGYQTGGFAGLISATPFTSITVSGAPGNADGYTLDDLTYARSATVPDLSSPALLLGVAAAPLLLARRSRR